MKFVNQNLKRITLIIGDRQKHVFSSIKVAEIIIRMESLKNMVN